MQSSPDPVPVVSRSLRGHQRSLSEARALVAAWMASGQRKGAWCRAHGVPDTTLQSCIVRTRRAEVPVRGSGFIALRPPRSAVTSVRGGELQIELGGGMRLVGLSFAEVVQLARALRGEQAL